MKNFLKVCLVFIMPLLTACPDRPSPPRPCSTGINCVETELSGINCCSSKGSWLARNKNPHRYVDAQFLEETKIQNEEWVQTDIIKRRIYPGSTDILGCSKNNDGGCNWDRRYRLVRACLENEGKCTFENPHNPDVAAFDCLACTPGSDNCIVVDYNNPALSATQRDAIKEMWDQVLNHGANYAFTFNFFKAFLPIPKDPLCSSDRDTRFVNDDFDSYGNDCSAGVVQPKPLKIPGTTETYSYTYFKFPSIIKGVSSKSANRGDIDLLVSGYTPIEVTVDINEEADKTRRDVIKSITALKKERKLIISGKDFICVSIINIAN